MQSPGNGTSKRGRPAAPPIPMELPAAPTATRMKTPLTGAGEISIGIPKINIVRIDVPIVAMEGSTLIMHAWSEKAKKQMRDKQQGKAAQKKEAKDPKAEFEAARYLDHKGKPVVPSIAIKCAIVDAASFAENVTKVLLRGAVFVVGEFIPIKYEKEVMREDMVRVGGMNKVADLRYRPEYHNWSMVLPIEYNSRVITAEQVANLINLAGFSIGIGEWRPQKDGQHGRFQVDQERSVS